MLKYSEKKVRELCHGVKERDQVAIREMADYFLNLDVLNPNSILVPAPQHEGYAIYTKQIAEIIAKHIGCRVADVLISKPRETLYEAKLNKGFMPLDFALKNEIVGEDIYFIDNVIDTGTTFRTANRLFKGKLMPLIYASVN